MAPPCRLIHKLGAIRFIVLSALTGNSFMPLPFLSYEWLLPVRLNGGPKVNGSMAARQCYQPCHTNANQELTAGTIWSRLNLKVSRS